MANVMKILIVKLILSLLECSYGNASSVLTLVLVIVYPRCFPSLSVREKKMEQEKTLCALDKSRGSVAGLPL